MILAAELIDLGMRAVCGHMTEIVLVIRNTRCRAKYELRTSTSKHARRSSSSCVA